MKSRVDCFFMKPLSVAKESLRRFTHVNSNVCNEINGTHAISVVLGATKWDLDINGCGDVPSEEMMKDHRWPSACSCGYVFKENDQWEHALQRFFQPSDGGELETLEDARVGAMWHADWLGDDHMGPDGHCLVVRTPGGDWCIDGLSTNGDGWVRKGRAPKVTVKPAVLIAPTKGVDGDIISPGYQGQLLDGVLIEF